MANEIGERTLWMTRRGVLGGAGSLALAGCATAGEGVVGAALSTDERRKLLSLFTLNADSWWRGLPFQDRFDAAARAGFSTVEMWWQNDSDRESGLLRRLSEDAGVTIIHCTADLPNLASATSSEARDACEASLESVTTLGARYATIVSHQNVEGMEKADMLAAYQDRMAELAPLFEAADVIACIEPFNPYNHPGHFMYGASDAVAICRAIDSSHVKLNWDLFHMQRYEGNVVHNLREGVDQAALLQIADSPERFQPGTGEMNYAFILSEAMKAGFDGPMGLECFPVEGAEDAAVSDVLALAITLAQA